MKLITATTILGCTLTICTTSCLQSPQGYLAKGNQFFGAGKNEEAILNYRKAIQKDARFGEAYYRLALAELNQPNAATILNQVVKQYPGTVEATGASQKLKEMAAGARGGKRPPSNSRNN